MNRRIEMLCLSALLWSSVGAAQAAECLPAAKAAWVRLPPVAMPMMAGFARIENPCKAPVSIVSAESLAFEDVSLHETREANGVSRMREVAALPIASGKAAELKPGGLHLMLHGPYQPLAIGEKVVITLKLADGRALPVVFEVRKSAP
jgi:copper(I)-binding protein